jgi:hypothetical protein
LANAVRRLISTPSLRRKLISNGRTLAKKHTLEFQTTKMISEIENWVSGRANKPI